MSVEEQAAVKEAVGIGRQAPGDLAVVALTGSRAFGTATPDSDYDFRGVYVAPLSRVVSVFRDTEKVVDRKDPDVVVYELGHFARLAAKGNPTVLEVLWAEPVFTSKVGRLLRGERRIFLGARHVENAFGGYAYAQLQKAKAETGGSRGATHHQRRKFRMHTLRLAEAGIEVLRTGEVPIRVPDPERLWAEADRDLDWLTVRVGELMLAMAEAARATSLPEFASTDLIDQLVCNVRLRGLVGTPSSRDFAEAAAKAERLALP